MTNELFIKIIGCVLTLATTIITAFVVPWLKAKISETQLDQLKKYIEMAVRCANQIYTPEEWIKKKNFVWEYILNIVNDKFTLSLTNADIDTLIEGVVNEVKESK